MFSLASNLKITFYLLLLFLLVQSSLSGAAELLIRSKISANTWLGIYVVNHQPIVELTGTFSPLWDAPEAAGLTMNAMNVLANLPSNPKIILLLNSFGGDIRYGELLLNLIRRRCENHNSCQLEVYVTDTCASACVSLFARSKGLRVASPQAKFGFHASRSLSDGSLLPEEQSLLFYQRAGVNRYLLEQMREKGVFAKIEITEISGLDLKLLGIIDRLEHPEFAEEIKRLRTLSP